MKSDFNPFSLALCRKSSFENRRVITTNLIKYSKKCDKVLCGCDEIKAISQGDGLKNCPCFQVSNDSNSKDNTIPWEYFSCGCFTSVNVVRNDFDSFILYSVIGSYDLEPINLIDFKFYYGHSKIVKQNGYCSDIKISWKCFRISCIEKDFDILNFLQELVSYWVKDKNSILTKNRLSNKYLEYLGEYYITRFDYRFDFFSDYKVPPLTFKEVFSPDSKMKYDDLVKDRHSKKIYTGWSAWNRKNHYVYTRMYQKQVEILDHWGENLYFDYLDPIYKWKVWRLEFEFGSDFTVKARWKHFLVDEFIDKSLQWMALEYVGILDKEGWFSSPKSEKPKFQDRSLLSQSRSLSMFWSIWKTLYDSWINPYHYLDFWLVKKWIDLKALEKLKKQSNSLSKDIPLLNFKFENQKEEKKNRYENILKHQLWIEQEFNSHDFYD